MAGAIQWENTIGGSGYDHLQNVRQTQDGGYIAAITSGSGVSGDKTNHLSATWITGWLNWTLVEMYYGMLPLEALKMTGSI